jgi:hypothetical protein
MADFFDLEEFKSFVGRISNWLSFFELNKNPLYFVMGFQNKKTETGY